MPSIIFFDKNSVTYSGGTVVKIGDVCTHKSTGEHCQVKDVFVSRKTNRPSFTMYYINGDGEVYGSQTVDANGFLNFHTHG